MSCDCIEPSCATRDEPRARKPHRCTECCHAILPGERYVRVTGIWDGSANSYAFCLPCDRLQALLDSVGEECVCYGGLLDAIDYELSIFLQPPETTDKAALFGWALGLHVGRRMQSHDATQLRLAALRARRASTEVRP